MGIDIPRAKWSHLAVHEAGHAVMCWRLRRAFEYATIEATEDAYGHVREGRGRRRRAGGRLT